MRSRTSFIGRILLVLLGMAVSVPIHVCGVAAGMVIMIMLGLGPIDGPWPPGTQEAFVISYGLWEWLFLGPAVFLLRRRQAFSVSWGVVSTGLLGTAFSAAGLVALCWRTFVP
jgi:hypothetical protein